MPPGRPRGSGAVTRIPDYVRTDDEAAAFLTGYRIAAAERAPDPDGPADAAELLKLAAPADRRRLAGLPRSLVENWAMVGAMQCWLDRAVHAARRA
jgi:hypothetical protein